MLLELMMGAPVVVVNPPTGFSATPIDATRIDLAWTNASGGLDTEIYRNGSLYTTAGVGASSLTDNGVASGTEYTYKIRHKSGPDYSVFTTALTRSGSPPAPTLLTADNNFEDDVALTWSFNSTTHTAVRVYRDGVNVSGNLSAATVSYTDLALPNATYAYTVRVTNGVAESANSNTINETVSYSPPLTPPSGFTATATHSDRVALAWTNGDATAQTEVYRGTSPNPTSLLFTAAAGVVSFSDPGLSHSTQFYYRIRHVKGSSLSTYVSDDATTTTPSFSGATLTASTSTDQVTISWSLVNPPFSPTVDRGSWSDTGGYETAAAAGGISSGDVIVTYSEGIVPKFAGIPVTGTLTYLRLRNTAGTIVATLTDLTREFEVGLP